MQAKTAVPALVEQVGAYKILTSPTKCAFLINSKPRHLLTPSWHAIKADSPLSDCMCISLPKVNMIDCLSAMTKTLYFVSSMPSWSIKKKIGRGSLSNGLSECMKSSPCGGSLPSMSSLMCRGSTLYQDCHLRLSVHKCPCPQQHGTPRQKTEGPSRHFMTPFKATLMKIALACPCSAAWKSKADGQTARG